jgi:dimethylargininase
MRIAITREVSPAFAQCELTHLPREPIDVECARAQHREYEGRLSEAGFAVLRLPADASHPDSVFVEDAALALEQIAIVTRPGAEARRGEAEAVGEILGRLRTVVRIEAPATLDGGDVLTVGRKIYVGQSSRTNADALRQLREILHPLGYAVEPVVVSGCLHLKSAATAVGSNLLLVNPAWLPDGAFEGLERVEVVPSEPGAANALRLGDSVVLPASFPRTRARLEARGIAVIPLDVSEIQKAEGGVTCCSVLL